MDFSAFPRVFPFRPAAWLRVSGEDAPAYLQGQFSQDVRAKGGYGLLLSHKGRIQADGTVLPASLPGEYWIMSYRVEGPALRARLEEFIVADDVTVEDVTGSVAGFSVIGPGSKDIVAAAAVRLAGWAVPGKRSLVENYDLIVPESAAAAALAELEGAVRAVLGDGGTGVQPSWLIGPEEAECIRILAGIAAVPLDAGPGDLPQEAGLVETAVAFEKGCYVGQEVMARLKTRGRVRRRLRRVKGAGAAPAAGTPLLAEGKKVGDMRSSVRDTRGLGYVGLAMVAADLPRDAHLVVGETGLQEEAPPPKKEEIELTDD